MLENAIVSYPFMAPVTLRRMFHAYGTRIDGLLEGIASVEDLGEHFGADLYAREVSWLMHEEWAISAEDILWRRSKLGLHMSPEERETLAAWMNARNTSMPLSA